MRSMKKQQLLCLDGKWELYYYPDEQADSYRQAFSAKDNIARCLPEAIQAIVPGNYELDFQRAGLIEDPYVGMNMQAMEKYEYYHFVYVKDFQYDGPVSGQEVLQFDGIDTFAAVYLNGQELGKTDNMLIGHDIKAESLRQGANQLVVHIEPAVLKARENNYTVLNLAIKYNYDALYVRKSASMYGWDIMPRMLSAGLWRSVNLVAYSRIGFLQTYLYTESIASPEKAFLQLFFELELQRDRASDYTVEVNGRCGNSEFSFTTRVWGKCGKERIPVLNPELWWPRGYGRQALYDVCVRLKKGNEVVDEQTFRTGIRVVKLLRTSIVNEKMEGEFCFTVNGRRIFLLGTNWVPPDAHAALGDIRAPEILKMVEDIGCNAVRIWGGSRYELDSFYSLCDEKGIFVWQDFMMGCGNYPQTPEFSEKFREEAVWVIRRLRHHPCICVWAGDNECDQNYIYQVNFTDPNDNMLTRRMLHHVLLNEDYTRPYLPSSPYYDEECYRKGVENVPENHLWGDRKYYKSDFYRCAKALFASEMGYHGCPSPDSIRRFISKDKVWDYHNEEWLLHSSCPDPKKTEPFAYRNDLMANQIKTLFGTVPDNLEQFALASQISQAEAMQFFIQHFRCRKGLCTGIIWWNICDGWPQISDAVVDYYFTKKLAYDYIQRSQQPVCFMLNEEQDGRLTLIGVNDTQKEQEVCYHVLTPEGTAVMEGTVKLPTDRSVVVETGPAFSGQELWKIEWEGAGAKGENSYLTGKPPYSLKAYVQQAMQFGLLKAEGFDFEAKGCKNEKNSSMDLHDVDISDVYFLQSAGGRRN